MTSQFIGDYGLTPYSLQSVSDLLRSRGVTTSRFTNEYGITPRKDNDFAVINLISQMGDNPSSPKPAIEAIAVWLANRWNIYSLSDLQFLWHAERTESGGADEGYSVVTYPGYFTAVSKYGGPSIPTEFAQFDDGQATYYLGFKPNAEGKPTFGLAYANPRARGVLREVALPLLAIGSLVFDWSGTTGYAILGVGDAIAGAAVAGEIAATIGISAAQVAQMVGSAAIGTVISGGDPVKGIENAAAAYLGAQAGNFVSSAVDSAAAGKIAAAAATAGALGKDVGQAILIAGAPLAAGAAAGSLNTRTTVDDYLFPGTSDSFGYDLGSDSLGYDLSLSTGDVLVSFDDLSILGQITIDGDALMREGLDAAALVPDELGILYNVAGQWVNIPAEEYAAQLYAAVGPNGGVEILGPDNNVIVTELEVANATSDADLQTKTLEGLAARSGSTKISGDAPSGRPEDLTQPAAKTTVSPLVDFAKTAESLTKSLATIFTVIKQVENGTYGRVQNPYGSLNPYGTLRPQQPGVPVRNADGSVTVNNGNGTQTTTKPNGQVVTTRTSVAGFGSGTFGGISTNTILIAGAGLAALLLLRRK